MYLKTSDGDKNITTATESWTRECYQETASAGSSPSGGPVRVMPSPQVEAAPSQVSSSTLAKFKEQISQCAECGECNCNCKRMKKWIWMLGGFIFLLVIVILWLLFSDEDGGVSSSSSSSWFSSKSSSSPKSSKSKSLSSPGKMSSKRSSK